MGREEMTKGCTSALIVAKPGPLRDSLQALMAAMPQIEAAYEVNDLASSAEMTFACGPTLVLLDCSLNGGDTWMAVRRAKAKWPQARCILLANDVQQHQEAEAAGADAVLLKGFPAASLVATIVRLLPRQVA
jgi:DNA-binding NarL/FixJ family response regulator